MIQSEVTPGRPRKEPRPEDIAVSWAIDVTVGPVDATRCQRELERSQTFVLITTVPPNRLSALLREYKGQTSVERHFHFIKDPLFVDGWLLNSSAM